MVSHKCSRQPSIRMRQQKGRKKGRNKWPGFRVLLSSFFPFHVSAFPPLEDGDRSFVTHPRLPLLLYSAQPRALAHSSNSSPTPTSFAAFRFSPPPPLFLIISSVYLRLFTPKGGWVWVRGKESERYLSPRVLVRYRGVTRTEKEKRVRVFFLLCLSLI